MEILSLGRGLDDTSANDKITKMLAVVALGREALDERLHDGEDLLLLDRATVQLIEALPVVAAAELRYSLLRYMLYAPQ